MFIILDAPKPLFYSASSLSDSWYSFSKYYQPSTYVETWHYILGNHM